MAQGGPPSQQASASAMFACGTGAGLIEAVCVQPFDIVKTRFQLNAGGNRSILGELRALVQEGGVARLYRGCEPELASNMAARSVLYVSNDLAREAAMPYVGSLLAPFFGGLFAGVPEAVATTPFQVVKVRLQSKEHLGRYLGFGHCVTTLLREGSLQWFSGLGSTAMRNSVWNCVYFGTMPLVKPCIQTNYSKADSFLTGYGCGTLATCFNAPFDVAKSRMQRQLPGESKYSGTLQCLTSIAREEGVRACYKGFAPKVIRMALGGGIGITAYESLKEYVSY